MTRTDFSLLRSEAISRSMLGRQRLTAPAVRVDAPHDLTTMRFSRTLCERRPTERSSTAVIVPMAEPRHPIPRYDLALYIVGAIGAVVAIVFNNFH